jgi:phosphate acetyltransferase
MAVVYPVDEEALLGAVEAQRMGLVTLLLAGPSRRVGDVARRAGLDLDDVQILEAEDAPGAAEAGVDAVRSGRADLLAKGSLHTSTLLSAVFGDGSHRRNGRRASHVFVLAVPGFDRPIFLTDAVVNVAPDLAQKADICRNAVDLAVALGVERPRVAVLSAAEDVNPLVPSTLDAAALSEMATRGQIDRAIVDGPLALDDAISPRAVAAKGIRSPVGGRADVLVVPNLEAGNILYKCLVQMAGANAAGVVVGTAVPVVVVSRADSVETRVASAALGCIWARQGGATGGAPG